MSSLLPRDATLFPGTFRAPSTVRMALAEGIEKDNDQEPHNIAPVGHDAANARTAGPLQRVRSFLR